MEKYNVTKVIKRGNCTVVIHRPELDKIERHRREEVIRQALRPFAEGVKNG